MSDLGFAVVFKFDRGRAAIFEGSEEEVYHWLVKVDQYLIWDVWDRMKGEYESAAAFLERLQEKYKPKPQLTEEDVRRIVDKRVGEILETIAKEADNRVSGLAAYEISDLMKPAYAAISNLTENIVDRLAESAQEKGRGGE